MKNAINILLLVSVLFYLPFAWTQDANGHLRPDRISFDSVTIAVNHSSYPYHFKNEQGQPDGLIIDYWKGWSQKTGILVDFKVMEWSQTIDKVSRGEVDIHAGLASYR